MELNPILSRPGGTKLNAIVEVHLDRILKAVLIFKGMMIEWVVVKGWEEELVKQDTGQPDIWGESRYHVGKIVPQYQSNKYYRCSNASQRMPMRQCFTFSRLFIQSLLSSHS